VLVLGLIVVVKILVTLPFFLQSHLLEVVVALVIAPLDRQEDLEVVEMEATELLVVQEILVVLLQ
jgi:hypothetical protein